jgi:hypothetical protein
MSIAHVVARAAADDPHTLAVMALAEALAGRPTTVFAPAGEVAGEVGVEIEGVGPLVQLHASEPSIVVYHQQGSAPALVSGLIGSGMRLAVAHDGTPPDPLARRDLRALAAAGALGLATSDAAANRLDDLGFAVVARVPPVVARQRLAAVEAFAPTTNHLDLVLRGPLILTVDELATAVKAARVVQAYHVLRTYLVRSGHLAIAIPDARETNANAVQTVYREVWGLRLTEAWAHHLENPGERAALTRRASVFVTADPAVGDTRYALAAMAEGVAVVAPADASAAGVLGDGALLLPSDAGVALVAEAVAELLNNESRHRRFVESAARRIAQFDPARVAPSWRDALAA